MFVGGNNKYYTLADDITNLNVCWWWWIDIGTVNRYRLAQRSANEISYFIYDWNNKRVDALIYGGES
jgi:hypothetical protein